MKLQLFLTNLCGTARQRCLTLLDCLHSHGQEFGPVYKETPNNSSFEYPSFPTLVRVLFRTQAALVPPFLLDRRRLANPGGETLAVPRREYAELNKWLKKTTNAASINDKMMATPILTL